MGYGNRFEAKNVTIQVLLQKRAKDADLYSRIGRVFPLQIAFTHNLGYRETRFWARVDLEGNIELPERRFFVPE
jgi:hypothetical protein